MTKRGHKWSYAWPVPMLSWGVLRPGYAAVLSNQVWRQKICGSGSIVAAEAEEAGQSSTNRKVDPWPLESKSPWAKSEPQFLHPIAPGVWACIWAVIADAQVGALQQ